MLSCGKLQGHCNFRERALEENCTEMCPGGAKNGVQIQLSRRFSRNMAEKGTREQEGSRVKVTENVCLTI